MEEYWYGIEGYQRCKCDARYDQRFDDIFALSWKCKNKIVVGHLGRAT